MKRIFLSGAAGAFIMLAVGCASDRGVRPAAADANWRQADQVDVALSEFQFTPETIRLKYNQPTIMTLRNTGRTKHEFASDKFFGDVRSYKLARADDSEIVGDVDELHLEAGETLQWYFIPKEQGTYPLECHVEDHDKRGMIGTIIVE